MKKAACVWAIGEENRVPVDRIIPTPNNNRPVRRDTPQFLELVESIRTKGILQNLVGRPHPTQEGMIDLLAGSRRYAAAVDAGKDTVPVRVLDLSDKEAMEITMVENLHREDLTPLQEAEAVKKMLLAGFTEHEIAARSGKHWTWVVRRNRLNELSPQWWEALQNEDGRFAHYTAAHLELLSKYPMSMQEALLTYWLSHVWDIPNTAKQLEAALQSEERALGEVQWDLYDVDLVPEAGSCAACQKRKNCIPGLFDDQMEPDSKDDRCLDDACFRSKAEAYRKKQVAEAVASHPAAKLVSHTNRSNEGVPSWKWSEAKKSDKGATKAVITDGPEAGKVIYAVIRPDDPPQQERVLSLDEKIQKKLDELLAAGLAAAPRPKWFNALVAVQCGDLGLAALVEASQKTRPEKELLDEAWLTLRDSIAESLTYMDVDFSAPNMRKFLKDRLAIDLAKLRAQAKADLKADVEAEPEADKPAKKKK